MIGDGEGIGVGTVTDGDKGSGDCSDGNAVFQFAKKPTMNPITLTKLMSPAIKRKGWDSVETC